MNLRTLRLLEYNKIVEMLTSYAASPMAKRKCERLKPRKVTYEDPQQMVVLDATDGSYIDILEVSKALGTCSVIQD